MKQFLLGEKVNDSDILYVNGKSDFNMVCVGVWLYASNVDRMMAATQQHANERYMVAWCSREWSNRNEMK